MRRFSRVAVKVAHVYVQHICMEAEQEKQRGVGSGDLGLSEAGEVACSSHGHKGWIERQAVRMWRQVGSRLHWWYVLGGMANSVEICLEIGRNG